jgi:hypothetical protein
MEARYRYGTQRGVVGCLFFALRPSDAAVPLLRGKRESTIDTFHFRIKYEWLG